MSKDKKQQTKTSATKAVETPRTSAKQRRHERNISRAAERRAELVRKGNLSAMSAIIQRDKIEQKRTKRARLRSMTPAQRAERRAAGMEHRAPRKK